MKKLLLLAVLGLTAVSAMAQGRVSFRNTASTSFNIYTNDAFRTLDAVPILNRLTQSNAVAQYRIGLYASPTTGATSNSLTLVSLITNSASPTLAGKIFGADPLVLSTAAGYSAGSAITFQIRAWSFAGGLTWDEAFAAANAGNLDAAIGASAIGTTTPTAAPSGAAALFGTSAGLLTSGFEIRPVPEPSSIALGLLGLGAIALFRRKK
jgi:ABC-type amino acid transport substrate-binding protein